MIPADRDLFPRGFSLRNSVQSQRAFEVRQTTATEIAEYNIVYQSPTPISVAETRDRRSTVFGSFVISANTANLYESVVSNMAGYMETPNHAVG